MIRIINRVVVRIIPTLDIIHNTIVLPTPYSSITNMLFLMAPSILAIILNAAGGTVVGFTFYFAAF